MRSFQCDTCRVVDMVTHGLAGNDVLWVFEQKWKVPRDEQRQHVRADRICPLCVPPMKSWENNPTTKQGKQIISPQTNCWSTLHTDYTTSSWEPKQAGTCRNSSEKNFLIEGEGVLPHCRAQFWCRALTTLKCQMEQHSAGNFSSPFTQNKR